MIVLIAILALLTWFLWHQITNRRIIELAARFPGPFNFPFVGNAWMFMIAAPEELETLMSAMCRDYGGIFRVWVGMHKVAFVVSDAKIAEIVLGHSYKYLKKSDVYNFLTPWLGNGLLLSTGDKWRTRRKAITPAFHFKILEEFVEIFDAHSDILVQRLDALTNGQVFNVYEYISLMALDNICEAAMGTKINAQLDTKSIYVQAVQEMSKSVSIRISKVWARNPFLFWLFDNERKQKQDRAIKVLHNFTQSVIRSRREVLLKNSEDPVEESDDGIKKKQALLDILLRSTADGISLSEGDIQEEVDTFMFEGHDTTTSAICFTLHLLSRHKLVQDKVYEEIRQVFGQNTIKTTYSMLQQLKYMELVIKESLRLYPPVPFIGRRLEEDTVINANQTIPADTNFSIFLRVMFRDPNVFERPDEFYPERFSFDSVSTTPTNIYSYCPFSAGTRNCIGQKFALTEMKCTISKILQNFELHSGGPMVKPVNELILRSTTGMHMKLTKRLSQ